MNGYIERKIEIISKGSADPETEILSPMQGQDFISQHGPKILLGEPGAGKTKFLLQMKQQFGCFYVKADIFLTFGPSKAGSAANPDSGTLLIDGYDELFLDKTDGQFLDLLKTIKHSNMPNWVVCCRVSEWRAAIFNEKIKEIFDSLPIIGVLQDFNQDEILEYIGSFYPEIEVDRFMKYVHENDLIDMARRPMGLDILARASITDGMNQNRIQLYESACKSLAEEREGHPRLRDFPAPKDIIDVAGWICAQLLLSSKRGVDCNNIGDGKDFVKIRDLSSREESAYPIELIQQGVSTALFSASENGFVEPFHRTIAEFLSARWIANKMQQDIAPLSRERIKSLFLVGEHRSVPSFWRGMHAWIATFDYRIAKDFVKSDPIGCTKYADLKHFGMDLIYDLISRLEEHSISNPMFFLDEYRAQEKFGHGIYRLGMEKFIEAYLLDENKPKQVKAMLVNSLAEFSYSEHALDRILDFLHDKEEVWYLRDVSAKAILNSQPEIQWKKSVDILLENNTTGCFHVIFDIIGHKPNVFSAGKIADVYLKYSTITSDDEETGLKSPVIGIDYTLLRNMDNAQVIEVLNLLAISHQEADNMKRRSLSVGRRHPSRKSIQERLEDYMGAYFNIFLERDLEAAPAVMWNWIKRMDSSSIVLNRFRDKLLKRAEDDKFRQSLQKASLEGRASQEDSYFDLTCILISADGLRVPLYVADVCFHIKWIVTDKKEGWTFLWKRLVSENLPHSRDDKLRNLAEAQAQEHADLKPIWEEINKPQPQTRREVRVNEWKQKEKAREEKRVRKNQEYFSQNIERVEKGEDLANLYTASRFLLSGDFNISLNDAAKRIAKFSGDDCAHSIITGIKSAVNNQKIPSVRECAALHAKEKQEYYMATICLARVFLAHIERELEKINQDALRCALFDCNWGVVHYMDGGLRNELIQVLEPLVFESNASARNDYIRDAFEPYLDENPSDSISALLDVATNRDYSKDIGDLILSWLENYPDMHQMVIKDLIYAAANNASRDKFIKLARKMAEDHQHHNFVYWACALFYVDHEWFCNNLANKVEKDFIWIMRNFIAEDRPFSKIKKCIDNKLLKFVVGKFSALWPNTNHPSGVWSGDRNSFDATDFIKTCIYRLTESPEGLRLLQESVSTENLDEYEVYAKWVLTHGKTEQDEQSFEGLSLENAQEILCGGKPSSIDDFQIIVLEALEAIQGDIRSGNTQGHQAYWNDDGSPHGEEHCRDRVCERLREHMDRYNIKVIPEGRMPSNTRCDIVCAFQDWEMPIELKGQWHRDVWTAAIFQLQANYAIFNRSHGRGIYLPLWFGHTHDARKAPLPYKGKRPTSFDEFRQCLIQETRGKDSRIKVFVMNLSPD